MAVEWTITIEGKNEFGDVCRREVRIDKSWERLFDGDIGLSIDDGKTIMTAAKRGREPRGGDVCPFSSGLPGLPQVSAGQGLHDAPDPDRLRHRGGAQSSLDDLPRLLPGHGRCLRAAKEICPDRATSELMELSALLGSMMPYRQAASVLAEFLPVEPTETHATVRKRTIRIGGRLDEQVAEEELRARAQTDERRAA